MERRNGSQLLLIIGVVGLVLTMIASVYWSGASAVRLEAKVQSAAQSALVEAGQDWAIAQAAGQRVVVGGVAPSETARGEALSAVQQAIGGGGVIVGGVTKVTDQIEVAPPASPFTWKLRVEDGGATLSGHTPTRAAEQAILAAVQAAYPDAEVENFMALASGVPEQGDWTEAALAGVALLQGLNPGAAELEDDVLTIRGVAADASASASIQGRLADLDPPYSGRSLVTGRYAWVASLDGDHLVLSGEAPDGSTKRALTETARRFFDGEVEDRMSLGGGAEWTSSAQLALRHFARFSSGRLTIADRTLFVEGRATESVYDYLREDMNRRLSGVGVQYDVDTVAPVLDEIADIDLDVSGDEKRAACQQAFTTIMANNRIYFATNEARITRRSGDTLDKLVAVGWRCSELSVEIGGHTDDRGRRDYNIGLSRRRASAVAAYLVGKGLPADRITAAGYGPDRPATDNSTPEGRAANRRIEFTIRSEGEL